MEPVEIVEHDPGWAERFTAAADEVSEALAPWVVDIEHIGSTAVPGLPAKPVIDIMVGVRTLAASTDIVAAMQKLDYEYVPAYEVIFPARRYFRRWEDGHRSHQIHLVERGDAEWWDRHLGFRDWLRAHDQDRDAYAVLKRSLAEAFRDDRDGYTDAKTAFIREIEGRAAQDRRERG